MAGLNDSNPHLSKLSRVLLSILLGLGWQNLPQSKFFPFWSLWEHLRLGAQSQKRLLHTYSLCVVGTASASVTWRGFLCLFQGGRRDQRELQAPALFLPVSLSLGCQDGYWSTFQRSFSPGTGALARKPIVNHLQGSDHDRDPTLQSTCTFTSNPDGKPACSACSVRCFPCPFSVVPLVVFSKSLQIYSSVT